MNKPYGMTVFENGDWIYGYLLNKEWCCMRKEWYKVETQELLEVQTQNEIYLQRLKSKALASGVEEYTVEKAIKQYEPDTFRNREDAKMRKLADLEMDYYTSGKKTIKEWAEDRIKYDEMFE